MSPFFWLFGMWFFSKPKPTDPEPPKPTEPEPDCLGKPNSDHPIDKHGVCTECAATICAKHEVNANGNCPTCNPEPKPKAPDA